MIFKFLVSFAYVGFWKGFCREFFLVAELLLIAAILTGMIGESNGVRLLFWHEDWNTQFVAGVATSLLITKLFFMAYLLHADQAPAWSKYLPSGRWSQTTREVVGYLVGCWLLIGTMTAVYMGCQYLATKMEPPQKITTETSASNNDNVVSQPTEADPRHHSRTRQVSKTAFWIGAAVGLLVLTPVIGSFLFWISKKLRLGRIFGGGANEQANGLAVALAVLMVLSYSYCVVAVMWEELNLWASWYTPAAGLCLLLGLFASAYGYARFQIRTPNSRIAFAMSHPILICGIAPLAVWLGGSSRYKFRFEDLEHYYPPETEADKATRIGPITTYDPAPEKYKLISTVDRLAFDPRLAPTPDGKRPLILVCVSGGGIRAAVWTAAVLGELESEWSEFPYHIKLVSGASGGMVGAGYYVASLQPPGKVPDHLNEKNREVWSHSSIGLDKHQQERDFAGTRRAFIHSLAKDMLSPVIKGMIFRDMPLAFVPWTSHLDRGGRLEEAWRRNMGGAWNMTFSDLAGGERERWRPSLVYSPMLVEDGRRIPVSNVDLADLAASYGNYVTQVEPYLYSRSAYEFFKLFPSAEDRFRLATAARMMPSFPYFSPAGVLPTEPRRRVVDAGYFDNYGVTLATNWLNDILSDPTKLEALKRNVSGVVVIEIRDALRERDGEVEGLGEPDASSRLSRGIEGLTTPPSALLAARDSVSLFRNDEKLAALSQRFRVALGPDFFTNVSFQYPGDAPLSWYLTKAERDDLEMRAESACKNRIMVEFRQWLNRHLAGEPPKNNLKIEPLRKPSTNFPSR